MKERSGDLYTECNNILKEKRDSLIDKGYAVLAIGYFGSYGAPQHLDRISLDAISDTIINIARQSSLRSPHKP